MSQPSIKKHMIRNFSFLPNIDEFSGNQKVILITSTGMIAGNICTPETSDINLSLLIKLTGKFYEDYKEKYPDIDSLPNDGYITLKDVEIFSAGERTNSIPFLMVFYDQIIGVTIGEVNL